MTEPENLILKMLREMRTHSDEQLAGLTRRLDETNLKVGTLAERMVSMNNGIEGLRADVRMIALAVDSHASRLDKMEFTLEAFKH